MQILKHSSKLLLLIITFLQWLLAQNSFQGLVLDNDSHLPLIGANVVLKPSQIGGSTDSTGLILLSHIPNGTYSVFVSYIGYKAVSFPLSFPSTNKEALKTILLVPVTIEMKGITVTTTRTNNHVEDSPVRVEVLGQEEVNEEIAIRPGNISKLLGETSGIQIQQTSAISGNVSFRIQGLPGRYTQLLKDGFPVYGGYSAALSILEIPPLDLAQVEVIKGSASALYGSDAIAGIVNLVSKTPQKVPEWIGLVNLTHKGGFDLNTYYSRLSGQNGITVLASGSSQRATDVDGDGFTDLPDFEQITLNPKFYHNYQRGTFMASLTTSMDNREGGDLRVLQHRPDSLHVYYERNKTRRITGYFNLNRRNNNGTLLTIRGSVNYFYRERIGPSFNQLGNQISNYLETTFLFKMKHHSTVVGFNIFLDDLLQKSRTTHTQFQTNSQTIGVFAQDDWKITPRNILQSGLRIDTHNRYGTMILPRLSFLTKLSSNLSLRLGSGTGYMIPTIPQDMEEDNPLINLPVLGSDVKPELSRSGSIDINYHGILFNAVSVNLNQAFYSTTVFHPLAVSQKNSNLSGLTYINADKPLLSNGFDTNLDLTLDELGLFVDYSFTRTKAKYDSDHSELPLTPRQKLNITLTYEEEEQWRTGWEFFYTGQQRLPDQTKTRAYWTVGFMFQKSFSVFDLIINVENTLDVRQSKFQDVVLPPLNNPTFQPLWAPLDGIVVNIALEFKLNKMQFLH
jgi:iron complex outermembrane receptor protein